MCQTSPCDDLGRGPLWCASHLITAKDSIWSGAGLWFSRSRSCYLGYSISRPRTPRSPQAKHPRRIPFQVAPSGANSKLPPVSFLLPAATPERAARAVLSPGDGNACRPFAPFPHSRIPLETGAYIRNGPRREGSDRSIRPVTACAVTPRPSSGSSTLIEPPDRPQMRHASPCDASWSRAVMAFPASGPDRSRGPAIFRRRDMVFPKPAIESVAPGPGRMEKSGICVITS